MSLVKILNSIGGELVPAASGRSFEVFDPAVGHPFALAPDSGEADVDAAVAAAGRAFPAWSRTTTEQRSKLLLAIADRLEADAYRLAMEECIDTGKPLEVARSVDIPRAVANFRFFATAILHTSSELHATDHTALNYTLRRPLGAVACISPWNLPLYLLTWKVAPALAAGNTVVAKPSEITPMTAFRLAEIAREAGLPPGVLNIVHGFGAKTGPPLVSHSGIRAVSFTGGTATGADIARNASPRFKKISLELGGKNPTVVFADAEMGQAVRGALRAAFSNQGQICLCGSRILVEAKAYPEFLERFATAARTLRVGDPLEPGTEQGAVVSKAHFDKILGYIDLAKKEGGSIVAGGGPAGPVNDRCRDGWFVLPTVVIDLPQDCRTNREEVFGPFVSVIPFADEDEAVAMANGTEYGLAASLWTENLSRAHRVADRLDAGTVWVNCWMLRDLRVPFGGMKSSGVGREGGEEALRFFTEPKNICVQVPE